VIGAQRQYFFAAHVEFIPNGALDVGLQAALQCGALASSWEGCSRVITMLLNGPVQTVLSPILAVGEEV
jgi:hypothetical protein